MAVVGLLLFLWVELVYDRAASPRLVAQFVTSYCLAHAIAGAVFGPSWFSRADSFEVYSSMVARLSPLGRRRDGALVVRNPLDGLAGTRAEADLTPMVVTILGSTVFDGLSRTPWWSDMIAGTDRTAYLVIGTAGFAGAIGVIALSYAAAMGAMRRRQKLDVDPRPYFAPTLVPIAVGYTVAHYFSFALFQGQKGLLLANDPFARGWDLLGLQETTVNYTLLSSAQISVVQISAIVIGHVVAVIAAHDRAVRVLPPAAVTRGQYPLMIAMVEAVHELSTR